MVPPPATGHHIARTNNLVLIDEMFSTGADIVVVEGALGAGKTTLLGDFVRAREGVVVSAFMRSVSQYAMDVDIVERHLARGLHALLIGAAGARGSEIDSDPDTLRQLFPQADRVPRKLGAITFVIDGLDEVLPSNPSARSVLEVLPIGVTGFRFLFSANRASDLELPPTARVRTTGLPPFTEDEVRRVLSPTTLSSDDLAAVMKVSRGQPMFVDCVRRVLSSGATVNTIIGPSGFAKVSDALDYDWHRSDWSADAAFAACVVSFTQVPRSADVLAKIVGTDAVRISESFERSSFMEMDPESGYWYFRSEPHRQYVAHRFDVDRIRVERAVIGYLASVPDALEAMAQLPSLYERVGERDQMFAYMSPTFLVASLNSGDSLTPIRRNTSLGVDAAFSAGRDSELVRFALHNAVVSGLFTRESARLDVGARVALGDLTSAMAQATQTKMKEERILLLLMIAFELSMANQAIPDSLGNQIRELHSQVDLAVLLEHSDEVIPGLLAAAPDLAVPLLESTPNVTKERRGAVELRAALSATVLASRTDAQSIRSKIENPKIRQASLVAEWLLKEKSAIDALASLDHFDAFDTQMFMLRHWAQVNQFRPDAIDVADAGLAKAIAHAEYRLSARHARQICVCLPHSEPGRAADIVARLDALQEAFWRLGPTVECVRLEALLAESAISHGDVVAGCARVERTLYEVVQQSPSMRLECLAYLVALLIRLETSVSSNPTFSTLLDMARDEFSKALAEVLLATADHLVVIRPVLRALAPWAPMMAEAICDQLNVESRRDRARQVCAEAVVAVAAKVECGLVAGFIDGIADPDVRDDAVDRVFSRLRMLPRAAERVQNLHLLWRSIAKVRDPFDRALLAATYLAVSKSAGLSNFEAAQHLQTEAHGLVQPGGRSNVLALELARVMAPVDMDVARTWYQRATADAATWAAYDSAPDSYRILKLAIIAISGQFRRRLENADQMAQLERRIDLLPEASARTTLWADIAWRLALADRAEDAKRWVRERVLPSYAEVPPGEVVLRADVLQSVGPAVHFYSPSLFRRELDLIPSDRRDSVRSRTAWGLLEKAPLFEPFTWLPGQRLLRAEYEDFVSALDLVEEIACDADVAVIMEAVADNFSGDAGRRFTREQQRAMSRSIAELGGRKFPSQRFIKHDGYLVCSVAYAARIDDSKRDIWDGIIAAARKIPNLADRAYVLTIVGAALPSKLASLRRETFDEVQRLVLGLANAVDRCERLRTLAEHILGDDPMLARDLLRKSLAEGGRGKGDDLDEECRRTVDVAYRIDPEFAEKLADSMDGDPARQARRAELHERLQTLKLTRDAGAASGAPPDELARVAWRCLGLLHGRQLSPYQLSALRTQVKMASTVPVRGAFPILAWVLTNAVRVYEGTNHAGRLLGPIAEAAIVSCSVLQWRAGQRMGAGIGQTRGTGEGSPRSLIVQAGDRDVAVEYLRRWLNDASHDKIVICDPYFQSDDLEVLKWLAETGCSTRITIITGPEAGADAESKFRARWGMLDAGEPPLCDVLIVSDGRDRCPIHDRWWIGSDRGIRLGTSISGLGVRLSEISELGAQELDSVRAELDRYLAREARFAGARVMYRLFSL